MLTFNQEQTCPTRTPVPVTFKKLICPSPAPEPEKHLAGGLVSWWPGGGTLGAVSVLCGYLNQPGLQPVVYDDVVAVALEAVFVVVHHRLQKE